MTVRFLFSQEKATALTLDRLYLFDPVERGGTRFSLVFIVQRVSEERLELTVAGARAAGDARPDQDFLRRARFPESVLPQILTEFIDRCGLEGAAYREIDLSAETEPAEGVPTAEWLAALIDPPDDSTEDR